MADQSPHCDVDTTEQQYASLARSPSAAGAGSEHAPIEQLEDEAAVDLFAAAMKAKMAASRAKGRSGWNDPTVCPAARLQSVLIEHLAKGDPVDVANFAMMLWNRGEVVAAPSSSASEQELPPLPDYEITTITADMVGCQMAGYRDAHVKAYGEACARAAHQAATNPAEPTYELASALNSLRWMLNKSDECDKPNMRATTLLDKHHSKHGRTIRQDLEYLWSYFDPNSPKMTSLLLHGEPMTTPASAQPVATAPTVPLDKDELTRARRLMCALGHTDAFKQPDDYVRGILLTIMGQAATRIECASPAAPVAQADPRPAFEAHARSRGLNVERLGYGYWAYSTNEAWLAWAA